MSEDEQIDKQSRALALELKGYKKECAAKYSAENEKLRADVEDTKALLPNKHEADVPLRPTEHHDWWCVSIMERRKRIAAEKEAEKLRAAMHDIYEVYAGSEGIPRPVTCSEMYLYELVREMVFIAAKHKRAAALKETDDE